MTTVGIATGAGRGMGLECARLLPGLIDTPQGRQEAAEHPSMGRMLGQTPLARMGLSEEIAKVVTFALSDGASFLNGIDLLVDGGLIAALAVFKGGW
jgi:NAD(P)-dependent dehydrogenase (short-subunit alcohol dehydrogenase family)